jgi:hypothetical protein
MLVFAAEASINDDDRMKLAGAISRNGLRRLAGLVDKPLASAVSHEQTQLLATAASFVLLWQQVGFIGFACRDQSKLPELLQAVENLKCLVSTPPADPPRVSDGGS